MSIRPTLKYAPQTVKAPDTVHTVKVAAIGKGETRCPLHLGVIMTHRKKFGIGTKIIHLVCPLCVKVDITTTTTKTKDTDKLQRDLETLSKQYTELSLNSGASCLEITRLQEEIEALKEELAETKNVGTLETDVLNRLVCKALPKIEELIEKADSRRDPPTSVEQIQELHANMMELEKKVKAVSDSAQQVVSDALHDVLEQINEVATQSNKNNFASESDTQAFRLELDSVQDDLHVVKRTIHRLPARVTRNEEQIKTVMSNLESLEDRMDKMVECYDRQFTEMDQRVSNLERQLKTSPAVQPEVVSDDKREDGRDRKPSVEDMQAQLEILKLQKEIELEQLRIEELRLRNSQTQLACNPTNKEEELKAPLDAMKLPNNAEKPNVQTNSQTPTTFNLTAHTTPEEMFLWISNQEPLSSFIQDNFDLAKAFVQLISFNCEKIMDLFFTVVSESPPNANIGGEKLAQLLTKMKESPDSAEIQLYGCVALTYCVVLTSSNSTIPIAKAIAALDGVPLQIASLYRHENNDRILFFQLNILAITAFASEKTALTISESCFDFAITTIRKRIDGDAKSNDRAIVVGCISLLFHASLKSRAVRHSLIAKNGIELVGLVKQLSGHSRRTFCQLNTLSNMLASPNYWWDTMMYASSFLGTRA